MQIELREKSANLRPGFDDDARSPGGRVSGKCCCVSSDACHAPADAPGQVNTKCWNCNDYVCRMCSRVITEHRGMGVHRPRRWCDRCFEDHYATSVGWERKIT